MSDSNVKRLTATLLDHEIVALCDLAAVYPRAVPLGRRTVSLHRVSIVVAEVLTRHLLATVGPAGVALTWLGIDVWRALPEEKRGRWYTVDAGAAADPHALAAEVYPNHTTAFSAAKGRGFFRIVAHERGKCDEVLWPLPTNEEYVAKERAKEVAEKARAEAKRKAAIGHMRGAFGRTGLRPPDDSLLGLLLDLDVRSPKQLVRYLDRLSGLCDEGDALEALLGWVSVYVRRRLRKAARR